MWNHGGLFAEMDDGVGACARDDAEALGGLVTRKLAECRFRAEFDYSKRKRSEWPAFQASGLRAIKVFEERYVPYGLGGANAANIIWQLESPSYPNEVSLLSSRPVGTSLVELGNWILDFHRFHLEVRSKIFGV